MTNNVPIKDAPDNVKIPVTLSIRDVVFIMVAVASMATAWGLFGTRLSVVEEKIIFISDNVSEIRTIVKDIKLEDRDSDGQLRSKLNDLDVRLRNVETNQAQIKVLLKQRRK